MFTTNTWLRIVVSMQLNAILFGIGAIAVLSVPALAAHAKFLIPAVVVAAFGLAPFLSLVVYPRMRLRHWGKRNWIRGDIVSGHG